MAEIAGLKLIVPSSVAGSGVSVSASGKVTFTAASSITIEDIFSSTYDNYLIVISAFRATGGQATVFGRFRVGGSDATGSDYVRQRLQASSTTVSSDRSTLSNFQIIPTNEGDWSGVHLYLYGPYLTQPTAMRTVNVFGISGGAINDAASTHSLSSSYTSLTFAPSAGSVTGTCTVYGLSQ
jgi:hypothetical protein